MHNSNGRRRGRLTAAVLLLCLAASAAAEPPKWVKMPLLTPEQIKAGVRLGGEGGQWPRGPVAVSPADPNFLLLPIDVGGVYRSLDGGQTWDIAMVGWNARGANGFAIDPRNARRAIGIAGNSLNWNSGWGASPHGLYLTTDKAASWRQVLKRNGGFGGFAAFDPTSYNATKQRCERAFYLSEMDGLFRSDDGGETWTACENVPSPGSLPGGDWSYAYETQPRMAVDPRSGAVCLAGAMGVWVSRDHAQTWQKRREQSTYSIAFDRDGALYASGPDGLSTSADYGKTWRKRAGEGLEQGADRRIQDLTISPADPARLLCWLSGPNFVWKRYVSFDHGERWAPVRTEKGDAPLPMNGRQSYATWSPTDPAVAWTLGGDWIVKSIDGGRTFHWSSGGYNGVMTGGHINISASRPECVFVGFQDYNAAFTRDGGKSWNYRDVSGKGWGGHVYGAYTPDGVVLYGGEADNWGAPRRLRISRDGGTTWSYVTGADGKPLTFAGADVSYGAPDDPKVLFASNLRSIDGGQHWAPMQNCDGVFTADAASRTLYGRHGNAVVRSTDHGANWSVVATAEGGIDDIAVDAVGKRIYVASQERLKMWQAGRWTTVETPRDQYGNVRVTTVAVDPRDPATLYVGGPRNIYASHATICRSTDSGATWQNLTMTVPIPIGYSGGPHEVGAIRVNPATREAWVAGQCFGLWRIAPPR